METLQARIRSFSKSKSTKNSSSKSNNISNAGWPHPGTFKATPTSLADAGFYFKPSKDDPDNVTCFMCNKELGGWEQDDDPFEIHSQKSPKCPWAVARCTLLYDFDSDGNFSVSDATRLPTSKLLEKARLDTYGGKEKLWPHDASKGHGATSKKMAKAGFIYTPQSSGDDTATCFYCDLALSGWDEGDDPLSEHRKRDSRGEKPCPFFHAQPASSSKPRSSRKAPASRKTRSTKPEPAIVEESEESQDEVIVIAPSEPSDGPTKKRKPKPKPDVSLKPASATQSSTRVASTSQSTTATLPSTTSTTRASRKPKSEMGQSIAAEVVPKPKLKKTKKSKPTRSQLPTAETDEQTDQSTKAEASREIEPELNVTQPNVTLTPPTEPDAEAQVEDDHQPPPAYSVPNLVPEDAMDVDPGTDADVDESGSLPTPEPILITPKRTEHAVGFVQETPDEPPPANPALVPSPVPLVPLNDTHLDDSPMLFIPPLATIPMKHISSLTDEERAMTVEQWIRHEMALQYEQLKHDGESRIEAFKQRAREARARIEEL